jgi:hypothetical protein
VDLAPGANEEVDRTLWAAILALYERGIATGIFAGDFPEICIDGSDVCGCDRGAMETTLEVEVTDLELPLAKRRHRLWPSSICWSSCNATHLVSRGATTTTTSATITCAWTRMIEAMPVQQ